MAKIVSASVLRNHLADTLDEVSEGEKFLLVARNKEIVSAVVDIDFFEDLLAAHAKEYVQSIREARKQYKEGKTLGHEEIFGTL